MAGSDALPLPKGVPGDLTAASSTLTRVADRVSQTQIYQHGGNAPVIADSWQGEAKDSRVAEANLLRSRVSRAAHRLPTIGAALTTYDDVLTTTVENVRRWQQQWDDAQDTYLTHLRRVNNQPLPEEDRQSIADGYADERDAEHRRLLGLYLAAMEDLRTAGSEAATKVRSECDLVVPPEAAGSRLEVGAHVLRDLPLSGGEAMSELADELAPELIDALRPAVAGGDPAALAAILEEYGQYADDPYFAHAVMSRLGADGLMDVFHDLAIANVWLRGDDALESRQQEVMGLLGTLYATASGPAGDKAVPEHGYAYDAMARWRDGVWFPALVETGRTVYPFEEDGFAGQPYSGYWTQGLLLTAAAEAGTVPGAHYMGHVGTDLIAWDQEQGAANHTRDWTFAAPFGIRPDLLGYGDESPLAVLADDPVYALLHAASQDVDSTHALLLGEVSSRHDEVTNVVEYLVRERGGTMAYSQPFADQGALLAETVAAHGSDRTDQSSTALAAHYLHAYLDTIDRGTFANGEELSEHAFVSSRTATADLMVAHIDDLVRAAERSDSGDVLYDSVGDSHWEIYIHDNTKLSATFGFLGMDRPDDITYAAIGEDDAAAVVGDSGNPPALQRIINAAVARNAVLLNEAYANPLGDPLEVMKDSANFLVYAVESAGHEHMGAAKNEDAYGEYLTRLAEAGAGLVPVDAIPVVGAPAGAVYDLTTSAIFERVIDTDHATRLAQGQAVIRDDLRNLLEQQGRTAVIQAEAWEEGKDPVTWAANNSLAPDQNFIRDGELMPLEELLRDENSRRFNAFDNVYLDAQDGGAGALRPITNQVKLAVLNAFDEADAHHEGDD